MLLLPLMRRTCQQTAEGDARTSCGFTLIRSVHRRRRCLSTATEVFAHLSGSRRPNFSTENGRARRTVFAGKFVLELNRPMGSPKRTQENE